MATDPVTNIQAERIESPLSSGVTGALKRLADLPPSADIPYVTISLDWRPAGERPGRGEPEEEPAKSQRRHDQGQEWSSQPPSWEVIGRELEDAVQQHGPRGEVFDSLSADKERIEHWLEHELDPSAKGVFIVSCSAHDVFVPLSLGLPVDSRFETGPTPNLSVLARMIDDHPPYAVLLADQQDARLSIIRRAQEGLRATIEGNDYPRKQQQGGWSQRRYQARADERVAAFARTVAEETRKVLREGDVHALIIAGDEVITTALDQEMHDEVKDRLIGHIHLDINASDDDVISATLPIVEQAERDRELEIARVARDAVGADVRGAAGGGEVVKALQSGQVMTLVMVDDFAAPGWADFVLDVVGAGDLPTSHPMGGNVDDIVPVALEVQLIRLAIRTDAEIDIITSDVPIDPDAEDVPDAGEPLPRTEAAQMVDALGGVAALLRFDQ